MKKENHCGEKTKTLSRQWYSPQQVPNKEGVRVNVKSSSKFELSLRLEKCIYQLKLFVKLTIRFKPRRIRRVVGTWYTYSFRD